MSPEPYYRDDLVTILAGDCIKVMATLPDCSIDAVVTDPPYGLGFMGKEWDDLPPGEEWAKECLRVLKPGGHLLAFGGTRTSHRLACAIEDAGFEIRDSIAWLYGSGFPKSLDVSKAIDKQAGHWRGKAGEKQSENDAMSGGNYGRTDKGDAITPAAAAGWGTALKPAHEPIVVARKSLSGTVATNWLAHGTGALNIDACRIGTDETLRTSTVPNDMRGGHYGQGHRPGEPSGQRRYTERGGTDFAATPGPRGGDVRGRWPANVVLDESQAAALDEQSGTLTSGVLAAHHARAPKAAGILGAFDAVDGERGYGDTGGASRFFPTFRYEAKAATSERPTVDGVLHPTVKPLDLMRWLVRLVTPPGGTVLEPFLGSGTTAEACVIEGFRCIGIEREAAYLPLAVARLSKPIAAVLDFGEAS